jgi:hypothetical protein
MCGSGPLDKFSCIVFDFRHEKHVHALEVYWFPTKLVNAQKSSTYYTPLILLPPAISMRFEVVEYSNLSFPLLLN